LQGNLSILIPEGLSIALWGFYYLVRKSLLADVLMSSANALKE